MALNETRERETTHREYRHNNVFKSFATQPGYCSRLEKISTFHGTRTIRLKVSRNFRYPMRFNGDFGFVKWRGRLCAEMDSSPKNLEE